MPTRREERLAEHQAKIDRLRKDQVTLATEVAEASVTATTAAKEAEHAQERWHLATAAQFEAEERRDALVQRYSSLGASISRMEDEAMGIGMS